MEPAPFTIRIPDETLADLHERLDRVRWPDQIPGAGFRSLLPRVKRAPGFKGWLLAADRRTGKGVTVGFWESEAAACAAEPLYQEALRELARFITEPPTRELYEILLQE